MIYDAEDQERNDAIEDAMRKLGLDPVDIANDDAYNVLDELFGVAYSMGQEDEYSHPS